METSRALVFAAIGIVTIIILVVIAFFLFNQIVRVARPTVIIPTPTPNPLIIVPDLSITPFPTYTPFPTPTEAPTPTVTPTVTLTPIPTTPPAPTIIIIQPIF